MLCNKCKKNIQNDSKFCPECGAEIKDEKNDKKWETIITAVALGSFLWWIWPSNEVEKKKTAEINEYPKVILKENAVICYNRNDWDSLVNYGLDKNFQAMNRLISSGKCFSATSDILVSYLDPVQDHYALIMLPSGKGAYSMKKDLRNTN